MLKTLKQSIPFAWVQVTIITLAPTGEYDRSMPITWAQVTTITLATADRFCTAVLYYSAPDMGAEYCDERVCLSVCVFVCPRLYLQNNTSIFTKFFVHVTYGCGSVLLWRRRDMLCISGFMDDVIFAHKLWLLDVAVQLKRSAHAALGLAIKCAQ